MSRSASNSSYLFVAVKPTGGKKYGLRQASTPGALAESLRRDSLLLLKTYSLPAWIGVESKVSLKQQSEINDQLAQLLTRGVPLVEALEVVAGSHSGPLGDRVGLIREQVAGGKSLAEAAEYLGGFDDVTISVYRAAERTGDLGGAAKELAETSRRQLAVRGKAMTMSMYPAVVLSVSLLLWFGLMVFALPSLGESLAQADIELPGASQVIIGIGTWMRDNFPIVAIGIAGVAAAIILLRKQIGAILMGVIRRMPLMKDVALAQESARFFSVMGALTASGVQLADALGVANRVIGNPKLSAQMDRMRKRLIEGGVLRYLIEEVTELPLATRRLLVAAERSGDLETTFRTLAGDMSDEVDRRSSRLLAFMEPALILFMFVMIGSLIAAVMLPLMTLSSRVGA